MSRDFFGFSFNGVHSKDLNIVRVSDGDRYNDHLLPELEDKSIEIPGNDGEYYFGSYYSKKSFNIEFAFDSVTEENFRKLKKLFSTKDLVPLIFDERPYITYFVKVQEPPEFNFVCFDEEDLTKSEKTVIIKKKKSEIYPVLYRGTTGKEDRLIDIKIPNYKRIYKGEGSLSLVAYSPFGVCVNKTLADYKDPQTGEPIENCENIDEWAAASRLLDSREEGHIKGYIIPDTEGAEPTEVLVDTYLNEGAAISHFYVYNPGDLETPPLIFIPFKNGEIPSVEIGIPESLETRKIVLNKIEQKSRNNNSGSNNLELGILINCKNHLIEEAYCVEEDSKLTFTTTKNIYNEYIKYGDFFKIPCCERVYEWEEKGVKKSENRIAISLLVTELDNSSNSGDGDGENESIGLDSVKIQYDYLYI